MAWRQLEPACDRIVVYGAGDQARVNRPILDDYGCRAEVLIDDTPGLVTPFEGVPLVRGWEGFQGWLGGRNVDGLGFVIAIGNPYGHVRVRLHHRMMAAGLKPVSFADRTALISASAVLADGLQVMPCAVIHHEARLGSQCIVNTKALVEHDCVLESGVEIGPGAILCGRVHVGANTWVGAGATVRPRLRIGKNSIIGAGAVVVTDIPDGVIAVGVPARPVSHAVPPSALASTERSGVVLGD